MNRSTDNLVRYIESANIDHKLIRKAENLELKESISKCNTHIRESVENNSEGWWVPISFYEKKNANGRIYGKKLWENVLNDQRDIWVGAPMLADHPEGDSDGSPKDICGIWLDAKLDPPDVNGEGLVYGLLVPSGHIGADLKDHLSKGLKVGTSSSGFGKLLSDGVTVDPNSFQIERLSDWVLNPSQGTFFSYDEDKEDVVENSIRESTRQKNTKEKFVKDSTKLAKLEEKKFRRDMESFLEGASNIKDPQERLLEFKEIKDYYEAYSKEGACKDLKEKIEQKISEEEEFIRTALKEKVELKEELQIENPKDLKKKLTKIAEDAALLNKEAKDWKKIAGNLQEKFNKAKESLNSLPTPAYVEYLKEKLLLVNSERKDSEKTFKEQISQITTSQQSALKENSSLRISLKESKEDANQFKEKLANTQALLKKSISALNAYQNQAKELQEKIECLDKDNLALKESLSLEKDTKENSLNKEKVFKEAYRKSKIASEKYKRAYMDLLKEKKAFNLKEHKHNLSITEKYFEDLRKTYGNELLNFKEKICSAPTYAEAKRIFFKDILPNLSESKEINDMRLPESLSISPQERAKTLGENNFKKPSMVERKPKGWL